MAHRSVGAGDCLSGAEVLTIYLPTCGTAEAAAAEAATAEDVHLESTLSNIDKILLDMATEEAAAAAEEAMATVPEKEKEIAEDASEEENFNFQNLMGKNCRRLRKKS